MKVITHTFIILFAFLWIISCDKKKSSDFQMNQQLEGCWVGGMIQNDGLTDDIELRFMKVKADSTLAISLAYELGPRSRVWEYDIEINCQDHEI